jgi:hypothetical protein
MRAILYEIDNIIFELLKREYFFLFKNGHQSFVNGHFEKKMLRLLWRSDWYV